MEENVDKQTETLETTSKSSTSKSSTIQVFARVRPCFETQLDYPDFLPNELSENGIRIEIPQGMKFGWLTKPKPHYEFNFSKLFWKDARQQDIFKAVAEPIILHALDGFNATLFTYGQTGSGKTYTLSGGDTFEERGIIPRTLNVLYDKVRNSSTYTYEVRVSYIEIYNNIAYDLLSTDQAARDQVLDRLLKVQINETPGGIEMMHDNLVIDANGDKRARTNPLHLCEDVESAYQELFIGETNRSIAATSSNDVSSRSHCIFTLHIFGRDIQNGQIKSSKIHLVDLAGSERVENLEGVDRLQEAKHINESLFYLHNVIDALKTHSDFIPYRSSKMTMLLKDSLGGNCMTSMIATLSSKTEHIQESIQTAQFAQSVMTITNNARANVALDPSVLIAKLRAEVVRLRHELAVARGEENEGELTEEEKEMLKTAVRAFMEGKEEMPITSPSRTQYCFEYIRLHTFENKSEIRDSDGKINTSSPSTPSKTSNIEANKNLMKLGKKLKRREEEIAVLVGMLNQKKNKSVAWTQTNLEVGSQSEKVPLPKLDKKEEFRKFRNNHPKFKAIQSNAEVHKTKLEQAKKIAADAKKLKIQIMQNRAKIAEESTDDMKDDELNNQTTQLVDQYKSMCSTLKALKTETETIEKMIRNITKQIERDFTDYWMTQTESSDSSSVFSSSMNNSSTLSSSTISEPSTIDAFAPSKNSGRSSNATIQIKSTGDTKADETIRKFHETRAAFLKNAEKHRMSQNQSPE